ncbi:hypothetical protein EB475_12580 [Salmonella enterica]|nr:hypothetical protein [Salmonella enterica subsp. enterica serovar Telelkebir]MDN89511.1 hypothetical protein [Salmonella enterica subsp. enterica serovar Gaminara]
MIQPAKTIYIVGRVYPKKLSYMCINTSITAQSRYTRDQSNMLVEALLWQLMDDKVCDRYLALTLELLRSNKNR